MTSTENNPLQEASIRKIRRSLLSIFRLQETHYYSHHRRSPCIADRIFRSPRHIPSPPVPCGISTPFLFRFLLIDPRNLLHIPPRTFCTPDVSSYILSSLYVFPKQLPVQIFRFLIRFEINTITASNTAAAEIRIIILFYYSLFPFRHRPFFIVFPLRRHFGHLYFHSKSSLAVLLVKKLFIRFLLARRLIGYSPLTGPMLPLPSRSAGRICLRFLRACLRPGLVLRLLLRVLSPRTH